MAFNLFLTLGSVKLSILVQCKLEKTISFELGKKPTYSNDTELGLNKKGPLRAGFEPTREDPK